MAEMTKFLSQIATLWPGRHRKISYKDPAHADSHAEHDEGGCKRDGKIAEKLIQKTSSFDRIHGSGRQQTHIYKK
jgi:hypothetical protein